MGVLRVFPHLILLLLLVVNLRQLLSMIVVANCAILNLLNLMLKMLL